MPMKNSNQAFVLFSLFPFSMVNFKVYGKRLSTMTIFVLIV